MSQPSETNLWLLKLMLQDKSKACPSVGVETQTAATESRLMKCRMYQLEEGNPGLLAAEVLEEDMKRMKNKRTKKKTK